MSIYKQAHTHSFNVKLAKQYGVEEAIVLGHIAYWIGINEENGVNFHDGKTWMYQTRKQLAAAMPYFSPDQIRRITDSLVEKNILIKGNYNKIALDKTIWYAFADQNISTKGDSANRDDETLNRDDETLNRDDDSAIAIPKSKTKSNQIKKDNVLTMPSPILGKREDFAGKLNPDQKKIHDVLINYKPDWGMPLKSNDVCAWFLSDKHTYTVKQVEDAFLVYRQDAQEAKQKGLSIESMGGYILTALRAKRVPKDGNFEANRQTALRLCKGVKEIEVKEKYVKYVIGSSQEQLPFSLPITTFLNVLEGIIQKFRFYGLEAQESTI
jgi:hypothetical protein